MRIATALEQTCLQTRRALESRALEGAGVVCTHTLLCTRRVFSTEKPVASPSHRLRCAPSKATGLRRGIGTRRVGLTRSLSRLAQTDGDTNAKSQLHTPVLLDEILQYFSQAPVKCLVDGTLGAGGHAAALLEAHPELEHFLGIDVDPVAHEAAKARLEAVPHAARLSFHRANYSEMGECMARSWGGLKADAILLDAGLSSMQIDTPERGFSFSRDGPLDMRMGPGGAATAAEIVNAWPEGELARIFREFGEERRSRALAGRIAVARERRPIRTTGELAAALGSARPKGGIHPATRVFQALRIAVNQELQHLERAVPACIDCLAPGGRLAVISFHSLEDRIVKRAFLAAAGRSEAAAPGLPAGAAPPTQAPPPLGRIVTRKPVVPSEQERARNTRSRSAKLRVFERI